MSTLFRFYAENGRPGGPAQPERLPHRRPAHPPFPAPHPILPPFVSSPVLPAPAPRTLGPHSEYGMIPYSVLLSIGFRYQL
jgi:hypothetical protein